jgi:hypothetical protein
MTVQDAALHLTEPPAHTRHQLGLNVRDTAELIQLPPRVAAAIQSKSEARQTGQSRIHAEPPSLANVRFCLKDCRFDPASSLNGAGTCRHQLPRSPPAP